LALVRVETLIAVSLVLIELSSVSTIVDLLWQKTAPSPSQRSRR